MVTRARLQPATLEGRLTMSRIGAIHGIIHTASTAAAGAGAGLAQIPGSDSAVIVPIQVAMINSIALEHGQAITKSAALSLIGTQAATMVGRKISQILIGWIPGPGNAINAATAAALTEAIGWAAHDYFQRAS